MDRNIEKELLLFESISTASDYEMILKDNVTFGNFVRLNYILQEIGLDYLQVYFFTKNCERFREEIDRMNEMACNEDVEMYDSWLETFVMNIKDKSTRESYMEKMKVGKEW